MRESILLGLVLVLSTGLAAAQDMPLSQVLIEGEAWKQTVGGLWDMHAPLLPLPGIPRPTCMFASPDGGTIFIGSDVGKYVWAFRVEKDGSLTAGQPYCLLRCPSEKKDMPVTALTVDTAGRIYAATVMGIQVFDPTGRLCGVLECPKGGIVTGLKFGGSNLDRLMIIMRSAASLPSTDRLGFERKVKSRGVDSR